MALSLKSLLLLLTIVAATLKGNNSRTLLMTTKVTVQIINNLSPPQDLTLHCKSKNDDLGEHTIGYGEKYEFRFRPSPFFDRTLYFCSFRWPSDTSLHYFDIYVQVRDKCFVCYWKIWNLGACTLDDVGGYTSCSPWNPKPQLTAPPFGVATSNTSTTQSHL